MLEPVLQLARVVLVAGWIAVSFAASVTANAPARPMPSAASSPVQSKDSREAGSAAAPQQQAAATPVRAVQDAAAPAQTRQAPVDDASPFSPDMVIAMARTLAQSPYAAPEAMAPESAAKLTYDQYQRIEFRREAADWRLDQSTTSIYIYEGSDPCVGTSALPWQGFGGFNPRRIL